MTVPVARADMSAVRELRSGWISRVSWLGRGRPASGR